MSYFFGGRGIKILVLFLYSSKSVLPSYFFSNKGMPETKRMRIKTLHPGVPVALAQLASGFELVVPQGEIPVTETPSKEILEILRNEVDPNGIFISMPS